MLIVDTMKSYNPRHPREIEALLAYITMANNMVMDQIKTEPTPGLLAQNCALMQDRRRYVRMIRQR